MSQMSVVVILASLVVLAAQSHDSEGAAGNVLVEEEHERSSQHRLQQLGLQAFEQTQYAVFPKDENPKKDNANMWITTYLKESLLHIHSRNNGSAHNKATERAALLWF